MAEPTTPLMRQYHAIKKKYPQALLLFRLGDFYELFYEDAIVASRELQITLTSRSRERGQAVPMCGVPYHAAENYIARLIRAGFKVAICEQMEQPTRGKRLVRREVVRVITPGTATEGSLLEPGENNFLAAVAFSASAARSERAAAGAASAARAGGTSPQEAGPEASAVAGLAYVDLSTGEFRVTEIAGPDAAARLRDELQILRPREILVPRPTHLFSAAPAGADGAVLEGLGGVVTRLDDWVFAEEHADRLISEQFGVVTLEGFGLDAHPQATAAAGAVVHYLRETSPRGAALQHLDRPTYYEEQDALVLDSVSVRNLELVAPLFDEPAPARGAATTLLATLNETSTGMGARLLRSWILRPAVDRMEIEQRLDAVGELKTQTVMREELRKDLRGILDLERLTSRVSLATATPRDLLGIAQSLAHLPMLRGFLANCRSARLRELLEALEPASGPLDAIRARIASTLSDDPPATLAEPGVIRRGCNAELDELRDLSQKSKQTIAAMEERERKRTCIGSLKIRYNQVFGYYIEISKPNLHLVPPDYERKQTLVNAERFTAPELKEYERKILDADGRILEIERRLFGELRGWIAEQAPRLRQAAAALAQLDVLANFAHLAAARKYVRPELSDGDEAVIVAGRHPVIERLCEQRGERFVPNDLYLNNNSHQILIITGPNMGGKSTYLRQAALTVLMAQMGSFVPAAEARLPVTDRIFTRIGASDNLSRGRSTFLVEMTEVATILNTATPSSLVLLDEVGRGTATFDGLSIAWAVVEHLAAQTRARTLFATHYHELTELGELLPAVKNLHVSVKEAGAEIVFLRRVEPGSADKSYGIEVARLAGLPREVIHRAREILRGHEESEHQLSEQLSPGAAPGAAATETSEQQALFTAIDREALEALRNADLDNLKPIDALNLLAKLKKQIT